MSVQFYPNGIGGTAPGDSLDLARPLQTTGNVWYVSSLVGIDAATPAGQNREKPLATLAQAVTNALDDDIIVFLPGHTQTLVAVQVLAKRLTLIGEGTTAGKPAVSFLINNAASSAISMIATNCELRNIYFPPSVQLNTTERVVIGATDCVVKGCYFECGATDNAAALGIVSARPRVEDTTFISTATLSTAQPKMAILGAAAIVDFVINNVTVSAGTVGFSNYAAIDVSGFAATRVKWQNMNLLLGSDVAMGAAATGRVNVQLATGGSRVSWG